MSTSEELHEAAERAKERRELAPVSLTMAVLAVMVATVTLLGHRAQQKDIQSEARGFEAEVERAGRRADRFDLGDVFLEIALVVTSITLLTESRAYWYFGFVLAAAGIVCAASAFLVR